MIRTLLSIVFVLAFGNPLSAGYASLISNSPFIPPGRSADDAKPGAAALPPAAPGAFVFRGITRMGDAYLFSIYDVKRGVSEWIDPSSPINGFTILSYDPGTHTLEYQWEGRKGALVLEQAEDLPADLFIRVESSPRADAEVRSATSAPIAGYRMIQPSQRRTQQSITFDSSRPVVLQEETQTRTGLGGSRPGLFNEATSSYATPPTFADAGVDRPSAPGPAEVIPVSTLASAGTTKPPRHKVDRNNTVNNPSGRPPSH